MKVKFLIIGVISISLIVGADQIPEEIEEPFTVEVEEYRIYPSDFQIDEQFRDYSSTEETTSNCGYCSRGCGVQNVFMWNTEAGPIIEPPGPHTCGIQMCRLYRDDCLLKKGLVGGIPECRCITCVIETKRREFITAARTCASEYGIHCNAAALPPIKKSDFKKLDVPEQKQLVFFESLVVNNHVFADHEITSVELSGSATAFMKSYKDTGIWRISGTTPSVESDTVFNLNMTFKNRHGSLAMQTEIMVRNTKP